MEELGFQLIKDFGQAPPKVRGIRWAPKQARRTPFLGAVSESLGGNMGWERVSQVLGGSFSLSFPSVLDKIFSPSASLISSLAPLLALLLALLLARLTGKSAGGSLLRLRASQHTAEELRTFPRRGTTANGLCHCSFGPIPIFDRWDTQLVVRLSTARCDANEAIARKPNGALVVTHGSWSIVPWKFAGDISAGRKRCRASPRQEHGRLGGRQQWVRQDDIGHVGALGPDWCRGR